MGKILSNKYGQKRLDSPKKSTTDAIKTASAEATPDLVGNKIADKITSVSRKFTKELQNDETEVDVERPTPKKRYISPEERQQIIDELSLVLKKDIFRNHRWINVNVKKYTYLKKKDNKLLIN